MRILHILYESKGDPFGFGGVGIRAYEIYRHLRERHEVTLLCRKYPGAKDGIIEGLRHIFVGTESRSLTKTLISYAYCASQFVKKNGSAYDIVIEDFSPAVPAYIHAFTQRPTVLQVQGYTGALYFRKYNPLYAVTLRLLEWWRPRLYDNFIFINADTLKKYSLNRSKRIAIIPNGIPSELLEIPYNEGNSLLYLGRIDVYGKGLDTLLDAYREFYESFPDIRLIIAGDGKDRERFEALLTKIPGEIRKNIEMPGWVSNKGKPGLFSKALFVIFPSRHEVQPVALLEAMASGKAVLVSDIEAFRFVKDTGAGTVFQTGDPHSLAGGMKELLTNSGRKEMGQRGRERVKELTWDAIALRYEEYLHSVLKIS